MKYPIIFTGAGPGDPELITVKGMKSLEQADLIVYAGSLVPEAVLKWAKPECEKINSASLHLSEIIDIMSKAYDNGKQVVRLHSGDPSMYGAIAEQMQELEKRAIPYTVIPGVTAAFGAAAALGLEYTMPEISQTLILTRMAGRTPVPETESLESLAAHKTSLAIYLSISLIDEVAKILQKTYGDDAPVVIAYRVSHPDQKLLRVTVKSLSETIQKEGIRKQAIIIVGKVLEQQEVKYLSKLYDKEFTHEYRKGI